MNVTLEENTLAAIQSLQKQIPAGTMPDMIRYLVLRGMQAVQAEISSKGK